MARSDRRDGSMELSPADREVYARAAVHADLDALHTLIARKGTSILRRGLPYTLVAARNQLRDGFRAQTRRNEIPLDAVRDNDGPGSTWDPIELASSREDLRGVLAALAELDPRDSFLVWASAEGRSDTEIQQRWKEFGFEPADPNEAYLRKRRERARRRLREAVLADDG